MSFGAFSGRIVEVNGVAPHATVQNQVDSSRVSQLNNPRLIADVSFDLAAAATRGGTASYYPAVATAPVNGVNLAAATGQRVQPVRVHEAFDAAASMRDLTMKT